MDAARATAAALARDAVSNTGFTAACFSRMAIDPAAFESEPEVGSKRGDVDYDLADQRASALLCPLIRDVFGNPFRHVAFDPRWRTADTVGLARGIYEERAFDRLPLLADALMDAGCDEDQLLAHCRSDGPHVRGCWVVDLVLGKE